jgi:hypothetical protein
MPDYSPLLYFTIHLLPAHLNMPTHNLLPTFAAAVEEQVTELLKRVKELIGMPNPANLRTNTLYFKSFKFFLIPLTSNPFHFESLQMKRLHWKHATRTVRPQWMWPNS